MLDQLIDMESAIFSELGSGVSQLYYACTTGDRPSVMRQLRLQGFEIGEFWSEHYVFFSSRRRHTRFDCDWSSRVLFRSNWHWFRRWGTGEICNNGTHEIDVARWALAVSYPTRVTSVGGRYHFADDWEFPDTQEACFEFAGGKTIIWQGQSCHGLTTFCRDRGA